MKKIMKKALSFALVIVMAMSLLPMTVFASEETLGTMETPDTTLATDGTGSMISVDGGETYYFSVLAELGEYNLTVMGDTGFVVGTYEDMSPRPIQNNDVNGTVEVTVASTRTNYSTINFIITNNTEESSFYMVTLSPVDGGDGAGNGAGDEEVLGTMETPDTTLAIDGTGSMISVEGGETYYFSVLAELGEYDLTVIGDAGFVVGTYEDMSPRPIQNNDVNGTVEVTVASTRTNYNTINFIITNNTEESSFYMVTLSPVDGGDGNGDGGEEVLGTMETPDTTLATDGTGSMISVEGGETYYFSVLAELGEYDLTVIGDAGFVVGTYEDMSPRPIQNNDVNGTVEVTVASTRTNYNTITFIITNNTEESSFYMVTLSPVDGGDGNGDGGEEVLGTMETPDTTLATDGTSSMISVEAGETYYFSVLAELGEYDLTVMGDTGFVVGTYEDMSPRPIQNNDVNGMVEVTVASTRTNYNTINFIITNNTEESSFYIVTLSLSDGEGGSGSGNEGGDDSGNQGGSDVGEGTDNEGEGTEEVPYVMIQGDNIAALKEVDSYVYYIFTAEEAGALYLTMSGDNASWYYDGVVNGEDISQFINPNKDWESNSNESTDEEPAALRTIFLEEDDVLILRVSTASVNWERPAGNVKFNVWFEAGAVQEDDGAGEDPQLEEYVVNYDILLELGENTVELDPSAGTTIFEFVPEETGVYVFTTDSGVLGYWGAGSFFVQDNTENKTATLEQNFKNLGNSIMVGVTGEGEVTITVKKAGEAEMGTTIPTVVYKNEITPSASDEYEVELPNSVNITDDKKDVAVLGEDGYYHLNTANGPILFVNLAHETISLADAYGYGRLTCSIKNDAGVTTTIMDYNTAFAAYFEESNEDSCYPLTKDLMVILKEVGSEWYGETGVVGGKYVDEAWMFACCYNEEITTFEEEVVEAEKEDTNIVIKDEGKLTADSLDAIIESNKGDKIIFTVQKGENTVVFEFEADEFELIEGKETYDFTVELVTDYDAATNDDAEIEEEGFVVRVNFNYEGKLPGVATITIPVGTDYASETLYYYKVMEDGSLKYICDAPVDENGIAKVTQDSCSDYVLLTEKLIDVPGTGDSTNVGIWFAVLALGALAIAGSVVMRKKEF